MYYVKVTEGDNIVASTLSDILSEAVSFGNKYLIKVIQLLYTKQCKVFVS